MFFFGGGAPCGPLEGVPDEAGARLGPAEAEHDPAGEGLETHRNGRLGGSHRPDAT